MLCLELMTWRNKEYLNEGWTKWKIPMPRLIAYIPPERKIPGVGGWRWAVHPTLEFCVSQRKIYQHVGIFCVTWRTSFTFHRTRNLKVAFYPTRNPNASQWNIGCVGSLALGLCVGHVHFIFFVLISFAMGSRRKRSFQWNMGLIDFIKHCFSLWSTYWYT